MVHAHVKEHLVSIVFELGLIYLAHDLDIRCVSRVHEVHRIEVHHPICEAMQLLHQVLGPFLIHLQCTLAQRKTSSVHYNIVHCKLYTGPLYTRLVYTVKIR